MKENDIVHELRASEVKLIYKSKIKASDRIAIRNADDAAQVFYNYWDLDKIGYVEEMKVLLLNRAHRVLGIANISSGGVTGTVVDIRVVLQFAIKSNATSVILAHNHPSGNIKPSEADISITKRLISALKAVDLTLLDHIIVTPEREFQSLTDSSPELFIIS